jgi:hypothetical protein
MRILNFICVFLFAQNLYAQNHYVVQYNKLEDKIAYLQVFTQNTKRIEKILIDKPVLIEGDIVEGRIVNINEFVFTGKIEFRKIPIVESSNKGLTQILTGLGIGTVGKTILDVFDNLNKASESRSSINFQTRGGETSEIAKIEQEIKPILLDLETDLLELKSLVFTTDSLIRSVLYSENKTLNELKNESDVEFASKEKQLNSLKQLINEDFVKLSKYKDRVGIRNDYIETIKLYNELPVDSFLAPIYKSLTDIKIARNQLNGATFSVIIFEIYKKSDNSSDFREQFLVDFLIERNITSAIENYSKISCHRMIELDVKTPFRPSWVTGVFYHIPMNVRGNVLKEYDGMEDSARLNYDGIKSNGVSVGTLLYFDFKMFKKLIPSFLCGASYTLSFVSSNESSTSNNESSTSTNGKLNLMLGAGLRFPQFPFLSLDLGFSWAQYSVISSDLNEGQWYAKNDIRLRNSVIDSWKPSFFMGIGMHF